MQVYYTPKNISLLFWSWCTRRKFTSSRLIIKQNITEKTFYIDLSYQYAIELDRLLSEGVSTGNFISKLDSYGVQGVEWYVMFMQNGIIE